MNTVEEFRKAFAQEHVLKGVDWIFDLASALEERIEALEEKCGTTLELMERLEELEHWHEDHEVERLRQDRWHATRDAALMGLLAKDACSGCHNDEFIRSATVFADRAHGPLEVKAIDVDKRLTELQDEAVYKRSEVNALVKAAAEFRQLVRAAFEQDEQDGGTRGEVLARDRAHSIYQRFVDSLKPFEAVKP